MHPRPVRALASRLLAGVSLAAFLGYTLLCLTARGFWIGELAANWRWYAGLAGLALVLLLALLRRPLPSLAALALALWHLAPGLALYVRSDEAPAGPTLRVANANVLWGTKNGDALREWLERERFDVVALQELDRTRLELLDALAGTYPHQLRWPVEPRLWTPGAWGQAILSRHPIEAGEVHAGGWRGQPFLEARLSFEGLPVTILGAHPNRPGKPWRIAARREAYAAMARRVRGRPHTIVLGDLNATLYSPAFGDLLEAGELFDSRVGFGRQGSWLARWNLRGYWLAPGLRLGIDHVLVGRGVAVRERALGPDLGSDHLPVTAVLALLPTAAAR